MFKNGMRPVHPGESLREDYLVPLNMTLTALAKALKVPSPRINDIARERRGVTSDTAMRWLATLAETRAPGFTCKPHMTCVSPRFAIQAHQA
jgi:addiction module HigA family antidote